MKRSILLLSAIFLVARIALSQGVTTASMTGIVTSDKGEALVGVNVVAVHSPTGTRYGAPTRSNGQYTIYNMKIGGPYTLTVSLLGYKKESKSEIYLSLAQETKFDFRLVEEAVQGKEVLINAETDDVLNSGRTGAATSVKPEQVSDLPSIKRSTRDLTRLDPRSDGNFSFGGRNWLYNNISLDGSYFNNPFGLDDPAPGGQANAEPVPFDAVEQVQVSVAPFDVREGGFTGAGINTVTKSGTNLFRGSLYSFIRNEDFIGNKVRGKEVIAHPDLKFNQSGYTLSGPLITDKLFFFMNGEIEGRDDPGSNFVANRGASGFGVSRVQASIMDSIRNRMMSVYGYDTGPYEGYVHETDNEKLLAKIDWNISEDHNLTFRYNLLNAKRDLPPHPFVLSVGGTGRGPNENSLPFRNAGYRINNRLNSFALEVNSRFENFGNRFFASYNRFRDFREPFSTPFPTVEIGENGVTYTTLGHEPFSINNILDQDVFQFTDNFSYFAANHVITVGANFESFSFFNSFNIFRYGVFFLPYFVDFQGDGIPEGSTFFSLNDFFTQTDPNKVGGPIKFNEMVPPSTQPYKGEDIDVGQLSLYAQDEYLVSQNFNLIYGLRVDFPIYFTSPVDNPFSRSLRALDENGNAETVDQGKLPGAKPLFSPRAGFNWDVNGDRSTQVRGGTGIFTGRIPFVWIGNNISNPGQNPNLPAYQRSYDVNATDPDFKWPQVWTSNIALDRRLPWDMLGTLEFLYSKDINAVFVRNSDLVAPYRYLPDGRPYYSDTLSPVPRNNELNPDGGAGIYVIDNTSEGSNYTITAQLRKTFEIGLNTSVSYSYLVAKNQLKSTEIASVLWAENPVQGNPNKPELSFSEFGNRHRITGSASYRHRWSENLATHFGMFIEVAEGNKFLGAGGNRYSFVYSGDVNGDGHGGNDLIYIPKDQSEIVFDPYTPAGGGTVTSAEQWAAFDAFIQQDDYLRTHRGQIAERFGALNPWFSNIDLRVLQ
ncbi:MAG TPA: carboxypeptidase regulatory-like domain-containing protein, partial [Bacteroidota bacterium]|nr:carboxypeptidase regulatory-like domain-containing protein [Bacteroidota bacterium]